MYLPFPFACWVWSALSHPFIAVCLCLYKYLRNEKPPWMQEDCDRVYGRQWAVALHMGCSSDSDMSGVDTGARLGAFLSANENPIQDRLCITYQTIDRYMLQFYASLFRRLLESGKFDTCIKLLPMTSTKRQFAVDTVDLKRDGSVDNRLQSVLWVNTLDMGLIAWAGVWSDDGSQVRTL